MIGATARAEQFFKREGSEATKPSRKGYSLLGGGEDPAAHLTPRERIDSERRSVLADLALLNIEIGKVKQILSTSSKPGFIPTEHFYQAVVRKRELTIKAQEAHLRLKTINESYKFPANDAHTFLQCFVDLCRETMTKAQFDMLIKEAAVRARKSAEEPA